jgi:hypothetical protein
MLQAQLADCDRGARGMTIYTDEDLADTPTLAELQIVGALRLPPCLVGAHAFHEGKPVALEEVIAVDPVLRWAHRIWGASPRRRQRRLRIQPVWN